MRNSIRKGFSFGLTSGIITTLGLIVGLESGTNSRLAVVGGILTIALADSLSDALGIHVSEESEGDHSNREVWISTFTTFFSKFLFALSFAVPILLLPLTKAVYVSVGWGLIALILLNYWVGSVGNNSRLKVILEHLTIAIVVVIASHFVGAWISSVLA
ncbi:MAG: hypothetical protein MUP58_02760 [Candidatus Nanohaloarchaeota archaeon QJJ-9]|nr:hypothetical protein [Candidatus Nanohaloarchaeota archaeon QJJ-9]